MSGVPQVQVTATARFRCQDESGRFYYSSRQLDITVAERPEGESYTEDLIYAVEGSEPAGCVSTAFDDVVVAPLDDIGGPQPGQPVSVYVLWYCIDAQGNRIVNSERTIIVQFTTTGDLGDLIPLIEAQAQAIFATAGVINPDDTDPVTGCSGYDWYITAPAYFAYYSGAR